MIKFTFNTGNVSLNYVNSLCVGYTYIYELSKRDTSARRYFALRFNLGIPLSSTVVK